MSARPCLSQGRPPAASRRWRSRLRRALGGIVINADSMQVYRDLRIITARPTHGRRGARAAPALRPCRCGRELLGRRVGGRRGDGAGRGASARGRLPIFVGGTGLYFKALTRGLSAVPPIPAEVRDGVRARLERNGVEALHAELARRDPRAAERLKPARPHPRSRARSKWSRRPAARCSTGTATACRRCCRKDSFRAVFLAPERAELYAPHRRALRRDARRRRARRGASARRRGISIRCCRR